MVCDKLNIDVWEVISLANRHPRVNVLRPGPGVGGHCIAVDPWFIISSAQQETKLIRSARSVNDDKPTWVVNKIKNIIKRFLEDFTDYKFEDVRISCYGLAFKPDIDDLRESPAMKIAEQVLSFHSGPVWIVEPNIQELPGSLTKAKLVDCLQAVEHAHVHIFLVAHSEFKKSPPQSEYVLDTVGLF